MRIYKEITDKGIEMMLKENRIFKYMMCAFFLTSVLILPTISQPMAAPYTYPEPDPPSIDLGETDAFTTRSQPQAPLSIQEWTMHKTADNRHPDGNEQQLLWLMNRARANPSQEGYWLAHTGNPDVENAITYFGVNTTILQNEFDGYDAKPPAAFDVRLYNAAHAHSLELIRRDDQDHDGQFDLIDTAGFHFRAARGNVFSYMENALQGHAAFNIDWGYDGGDGSGMQNPRGHRLAIMSIDNDYTNVGLAAVAESDSNTSVGPLVATGNFCKADTGYTDHHNRFIVGTVWQDANDNDQYDPGEGMGGITVMPGSGTYYAVTADGGGYAFPVTSTGTYDVTFSGNAITVAVVRTVSVASEDSILLDLNYTGGNTTEPQAITDPASEVTTAAVNLNGTVYTNGHETNYYFQYGTTTQYGSSTATETVSSDSAVTAVINELTLNTTYHFRLVATNNEGTSFGSDRTFQTVAPSAPNASSSGGGGGGGCFITTAGNYR